MRLNNKIREQVYDRIILDKITKPCEKLRSEILQIATKAVNSRWLGNPKMMNWIKEAPEGGLCNKQDVVLYLTKKEAEEGKESTAVHHKMARFYGGCSKRKVKLGQPFPILKIEEYNDVNVVVLSEDKPRLKEIMKELDELSEKKKSLREKVQGVLYGCTTYKQLEAYPELFKLLPEVSKGTALSILPSEISKVLK